MTAPLTRLPALPSCCPRSPRARANRAASLAGQGAGLGAVVDTGVDREIGLRRPRHHEVSDPTLTVFLPEAANATGAAAVIAPGGALRVLAFDNEGVKVAEWLNEHGIAGFVLKYRTLQQDPSAPRGPLPGMPAPGSAPRQELVIVNGNANPAPDDAALGEVLELAVADAQAALALVRSRASEWRVDPNRVGIIGFSAGGGVAVGTALAAEVRRVARFPGLRLWAVAARRECTRARAAAVRRRRRHALQRDERLPRAIRRVEGRGQARGDSCLRRHQRWLRNDEAWPPGGWLDRSPT